MRIAMRYVAALLLPSTVLIACASPQPVARLELDAGTIRLGYPEYATVGLSWQIEAPLEELVGEPLVFVHLLDREGNLLRTFDHLFPQSWQPRARVEYDLKLYQSGLSQPLAAGDYRLSAGLYDTSGHRWPLATSGLEIGRLEYEVARITVPEERRAPNFYFSPSWKPIEAGQDQQVLHRRWLTAPGTIRVDGLQGPGSLWLLLRLPPPAPEGEELVIADGSESISLVVENSCSGAQINAGGEGSHEFELQFDAGAPAAEGCEVRVLPNFHVVALGSLDTRSVSLEVLAWSPQQG